ncbi:hypothetical protein [Planctomycetes bacterium K23_9]|uniref:EF hand n=1 Tax=Stieleria marina TaxID=1930275 RepID=A0A517NRX4_9BACT|nr:hypothetical protein K239x_18350 [Planctomycetes bacterium K23_9]
MPSDGSLSVAKIRKTILFSVLLVGGVALAYDHLVARPAVAAAYDQITQESRKLNGQAGETFSNDDVRKLLGKEPAEEFRDGLEYVEVYDFSGGLPGCPHRLYAVFKTIGSSKLFYRHAKFKFESRYEVSPIADSFVPFHTVKEYAEYDAARRRYEEETREQREEYFRAHGATQSYDREFFTTMFALHDYDGDGELNQDEMPPFIQQQIVYFDLDGSLTVSLDELDERLTGLKAELSGQQAGGFDVETVNQKESDSATSAPADAEIGV